MSLLEGAAHEWLVTTQGRDPSLTTPAASEAEQALRDAARAELEAGLVTLAKDADHLAARTDKLADMNTRVDDIREKLRTASEGLTLMVTDKERPEEYADDEAGNRKRAAAWEKSKQAMEWMAKDKTNKSGKVTTDKRDIEVDTVHDLRGASFHIKDDEGGTKAAELMELHRQLIEVQTEMEEATGPDGEPLFTAKDIERELWTPLIRADIIPSNAVADKYSQEAQVWNGACEMYQERLDKFTSAKGSKHEKTLRGLRIAGDTVSMLGSVAGEAITAGFSFGGDGAVMSKADTREYVRLSEQNSTTPLTGGDLDRFNSFKDKIDQGKQMKRAAAISAVATTVIQGGLKTGEAVINAKRAEKGQGTIVAQAVLSQLDNITAAALSVAEAEFKISDPDLAKSNDHKTTFTRLKAFTSAGFKLTQVGVSIAQAVEASDEGSRRKAIIAAVNGIITSVTKAVAGFGDAGGTDGSGGKTANTNRAIAEAATRAEAGLKSALNVSVIIAAIVTAKKSGKKVSARAILGAFALEAVQQTMVQAYREISDASRADVSTADTTVSPFEETTGANTSTETSSRQAGLASAMSGVSGKDVGTGAATDKIAGGLTEEAAARQAFAAEMEKFVEDSRAEEMSEFQDSMKDPETRKEFFDNCAEEAERGAEELKALIEEASASPDELDDPERAKKAMAAMDKLIAEAQAINTKWMIVETVTGGATGILTAALPVAGLAAAIQKFAMDIALLVRKSYELNKWLDNMALTYGNNSVYGAAIAGRCASAKVQVSQRSILLVFSSVGIAVESLKLADITGIATGISVGNNMARALTEYGYKMQKEHAINKGWDLYVAARDPENAGDRKMARKAMKWNSTLSKCVLAYGIVMDGDPIAQQVARSCGMNPEVLANENDVCPKVVQYFETLYSDDPVVLKRDPKPQAWHPGRLELSLDSWMTFKSAANLRAVPPLADVSTGTPKLDAALAALPTVLGASGYSEKRDQDFPDISVYDALPNPAAAPPPSFADDACKTWIAAARAAVVAVISAANDYKPVAGAPPDDTPDAWKEGTPHLDMNAVADSLSAQAQVVLCEIDYDLKRVDELTAENAARAADAAALLDSVGDTFVDAEDTEDTEDSDASDEDTTTAAASEDDSEDP